MKKKTMLWMGAFACGLALTAGCQNTVNTVENEEKGATPNRIVDKRYVTDGFLRNRLVLRYVNMSPAASGNKMVQVAAANVRTGIFAQAWSGLTGENPYSIDYKFTWQDENGMTVDTPLEVWRTVKVHPGETVYFKSVAPNERCQDFILNIKESK